MLILIVGPSGVGKDTLMNGAQERLGGNPRYRFVRRIITRPGDLGEEAHDSATEQEFEARRQGGEFALIWRAHGLHYAIPTDIALDLAQGRAVVANVSRAVVAEAARVLAPGGCLVIVDLAGHSRTDVMGRLAHRWPGFTDAAMQDLLRAPGLLPGRPISVPGPLAVRLWPATLPAAAATDAAHDAARETLPELVSEDA